MAFGVKTANMFELLGDGDSDVAPASIAPKSQAEPKKSSPGNAATTGAAVEARLKGNSAGQGNASTGRGRGEGRGARGGRGGRGGYDRPIREDGEGGGGGGGGDVERPARGRGGGNRHFERDRKRGYDRHDNTGRGHETEKRGGGGGHNWGAVGEEIPAATEVVTAEWKEEAAEVEAPAPVTEAATEEPAAEEAEPQEPEKEEMTLDEWEKKMEERVSLKKVPTNETKVDTKAFEGMKVYNPKEKEAENNDLTLSEKKQLGKSKSGPSDKARKEKELLPTGFRVGTNEAGRGGRGRGDRGGRRDDRPDRERPPRRTSDENGGGRGYGRGRSDRPYSGGRGRAERDGSAPALHDNAAFPTLGGK